MQRTKKKWVSSILASVLAICTILGLSATASAATSYNYDIWGNVVAAPEAYTLEQTVYASDLGLSSLSTASDIFYKNGKVYVALNGYVMIADSDFETVEYITDYTRDDGTQSSISSPTGLYVTDEGHIYVCEQTNGEIIEFDEDLNFVRALGDPNCTGLTSAYRPVTCVVDSVGRIYVLVKNCYEGIVELDPDGNFNRYVGATEVTYTAWALFWRSMSTDAQLSSSDLWLPTSYGDLAIDSDGFIFASITDSTEEEPIRKINSSGDNVLSVGDYITYPMGDYEDGESISTLTAIATADDGRFAVLDSVYSRIFVYSADGYLMYVLGGSGNASGLFSSPASICFMEDKILVVDAVYNSIEVFSPTTYGALINAGLEAQSEYDYETAAYYWQQVLDINSEFYYANLGLGKYQLRVGLYEEAMNNFYAGGDTSYYSAAYGQYQGDWMTAHFNQIAAIVAIIIVLLVAWWAYNKFFRKEKEPGRIGQIWNKFKFTVFKWPGHVLSSPFKAFDEVKYYDDGSLAFSIIIIIAFGWISLIKYRYTGFLVNFVDIDNVNLPIIVGSALLPYVTFIIGNWAMGTLMSGKGKMVHIVKVVGYSLYPTCWLYLAGTILSNFVTEDSAALVSALFVLGMVLFLFYMFIGTIMVHQYGFMKNVASLICSAVAMLAVCFVLMLLGTLITQVANDILQIITEVKLLVL